MEVRVFTMENCPFCSELKDRLKDMGIAYTEVDINLEENEEEFDKVMEVGDTESVPCVIVGGKHLLAPDVNFSTIKQAAELVKYILDSED